MRFIDYWDEAASWLSRSDEALARLIAAHRGERLSGSGDAWRTLANAVVGQQISVQAAAGIWRRLNEGFPGLSCERIAAAGVDALKACGLSTRKAEYLGGIAAAFVDGSLAPGCFDGMDDETVKARLVGLRGIGPWTAEMFMIFHLHRPDVLPLGDIGLQRAASRLYRWPEGEPAQELKKRLSEAAEAWRPFRTVAVWYLWRDLDAEPVVY